MNKNILILSLLVFAISSCKQIILWKYGITQPGPETTESIRAYLEKMKQSPEDVYIFKDSTAYFNCLRDSVFKKNLISVLFFTKAGMLDEFKDTTHCQWMGGHYTSILKKDTVYHVDTSYRYQEMLKNFVPLDPNRDPSGFDSAFDFLALVTWGKFIGKLNVRQFCIDEAAEENPRAKIRVLFLNTDALRSWNMKENQMIEIR